MKANKLTKGANVRWASSRMMLPEHVAALKWHTIENKKIDRPILAEDEWAEIHAVLQQAIQEHSLIELSYYKNGFIKQKIGYPYRMDAVEKQLIVHDVYGLTWHYDFADITGATLSSSDME